MAKLLIFHKENDIRCEKSDIDCVPISKSTIIFKRKQVATLLRGIRYWRLVMAVVHTVTCVFWKADSNRQRMRDQSHHYSSSMETARWLLTGSTTPKPKWLGLKPSSGGSPERRLTIQPLTDHSSVSVTKDLWVEPKHVTALAAEYICLA